MLEAAGFSPIQQLSHAPIARAQRQTTGLRNNLRPRLYVRFILLAEKPPIA